MRRFAIIYTALALLLASQTGCQLGEKAKALTQGLTSSSSAKPTTPDGGGMATELGAVDSAQLAFKMAESLEIKGEDADAVAQYEKARNLDPQLHDRAARRLAVLYDKLDNQAQAMIEFHELLKKSPKDADLLNDIGYSYYNRGQWNEAEKHLREALRHAKNHKRATVNLGMALAQQGRQQEALETWMAIITPAEAYANLGFVLLTQGKKDEARAAYQEALRHEPALTKAQQTLAKLDAPPSLPNPIEPARGK